MIAALLLCTYGLCDPPPYPETLRVRGRLKFNERGSCVPLDERFLFIGSCK